jgi:hypothetical protein
MALKRANAEPNSMNSPNTTRLNLDDTGSDTTTLMTSPALKSLLPTPGSHREERVRNILNVRFDLH